MADGDAWSDMQEFMMRKNSFREKLQKRKREREGLLKDVVSSGNADHAVASLGGGSPCTKRPRPTHSKRLSETDVTAPPAPRDPAVEVELLAKLCETTDLPVDSMFLTKEVALHLGRTVSQAAVENLLKKFAVQELIRLRPLPKHDVVTGESCLSVSSIEFDKLRAFANECRRKEKALSVVTVLASKGSERDAAPGVSRRSDGKEHEEPLGSPLTTNNADTKETRASCVEEEEAVETRFGASDDIMSLLSMQTTKERETKKLGEEIFELLSKPTAKERSTVERFRSHGGAQVQEFCSFGTRDECRKARTSKSGATSPVGCKKLHFRKIIQKHTDESLGDCSFLNTCFHMDTCKYVHYQVDYEGAATKRDSLSGGEETFCEDAEPNGATTSIPDLKSKGHDVSLRSSEATVLFPPQWVQCDLRFFDMSILGKFAVVMADPPWDIHMELPYGTMSDEEMRKLNIPSLQDDGLIFLWVTGRAMELGRECLELWGYERVDELIWVKTNQLQRIIRTGRTGHWLNHGKEHCLVGMKGNPVKLNRGLDCDVIVAEVRATSHKPDEIYGIIERLSPGTRKIELFGRQHNAQPNWITLGNQLDGVRLMDPELQERFRERYPDGNVMNPPKKSS